MPGSIKTNTHIRVAGSVRGFDNWSSNRLQTLPLSVLRDSVLGIDVTSYLHRMLYESYREPLLAAIGGFPLAFRKNVDKDLKQLFDFNIKPLFIFDGLRPVQHSKPLVSAEKLVEKRQEAWKLYESGEATDAVAAFGQAMSLQPSHMYKWLMTILDENKVEYQVAPYSSWAQLIYLERHASQYIDAIYGPAEVFFGDVEKVITGLGNGTFSCLNKKAIMQDIGGLHHDQFIDACLLAGTDLCDTFPPLDPNFTFKNALDLMKAHRTVDAIVAHFKDNTAVKKSNYLEKYRKAKSAIKYHVILNDDGKVEPMHLSEAPGDIHEFIGQRLPDEVYFYMSRGVMGPQVLDMLVSQKIIEDPPLDNGDGEDYRKFLEGLQGIRTQSLALLSQPLHRFWSARVIDVVYWYDESKPRRLAPKDLLPTPYDTIMNWNVKESDFMPLLQKSKYGTSLSFAVTALVSSNFPSKTIVAKNPDELRSFLNAEHRLTPWGRCLEAALSSLNPQDNLEESCLLAIELIRSRAIKPDYNNPQGFGLIVKVASLANVKHRSVGYTGPLSKELLAFNSIVRPMARSIKNLSEMVLVSLLLNGDAMKQDRTDWHRLGLLLGFAEDINASFGLAVKTYLDEIENQQDPKDPEVRIRAQYDDLPRMFCQTEDLSADLCKIFRLWDAVISGIKAVSKDNIIPDSQKFLDADEWVKNRRPIDASDPV